MDPTGQGSYFFDEQLFFEMEEIGNMGMYAYDVKTDTFRASPQFQKMFGLPKQSVFPGELFKSLIHPEDTERVMKLFNVSIQVQKPFNCEYRCMLDGQVMHVRSRSRTVYDALGQAVKVMGIKQDISEQKRAEEDKARTEQKYLLALKHSPVVFARVDTELRYEWIFNPHTDFEAEGVKGKRDDELSDNEGTNALMALKRKTLQLGEQQREQIVFDVSDGPRVYDITATPLKSEEGSVTGLITASLDITQQKEVETALHSSEEKLRLALKASQSGIFDIPVEEELPPQATEGVKALFGFAPDEEPHTQDYFSRIHPDDQKKVNDAIENSIRQKEGHYVEYRVLPPDGKEKWLATRSEVILNSNGKPERLIGTLINITELKRDEQALQQSQWLAQKRLEELENVYASAPVGLCVLDKDLRFVRINQRLAEINGFPVEYHIGKTVREVLPELADEVEPTLRQIIESGEPALNIEVQGKTPSQPGVLRTWIESWFPYKNSLGETIGINIVAEEVTEMRRNEASRKEKEERYRRLFNSIEDGFCVCEMLLNEDGKPYDYRFLEINRTFEAHTGLKDAAGKTALELVPNLEQHWFETYGSVAVEGKSIHFEQGSQEMGRWFDVYAFPFGKPNTQVFAIQFKDVTERKKREESVKEMQKKLAVANHELESINEELRAANEELTISNDKLSRVNSDLDNFVYTASHDLKAPITNLQSLQEMLQLELDKKVQLSAQAQQIMKMMKLSVDRFMQTIADMTDISRLQKQGDLPMEMVSIAKVVNDVSMDLNLLIEQSEAVLDLDIADCNDIRFAPKNLRSVVYNLLSNAIKYRHPDRKPIVTIRCKLAGEYHIFTVIDNGLGIDLKQQTRLFGMFQRLHNHVEGTGVGLYIVKRMVENAGGKIEVESEVGQGTTFRVFFKR